jgi:hypothetical protein
MSLQQGEIQPQIGKKFSMLSPRSTLTVIGLECRWQLPSHKEKRGKQLPAAPLSDHCFTNWPTYF